MDTTMSLTVCLIVATLVGSMCTNEVTFIKECTAEDTGADLCHVSFLESVLVGDCSLEMPQMYVCHAEVEDIMLWAQYYDPALCEFEEYQMNCDSDPHHLADGTPTEECYDVCMACPDGWQPKLGGSVGGFRPGRIFNFGTEIGAWQCRDRGGGIRLTYGRKYIGCHWVGWYIPLDFLLDYTQPRPDWINHPIPYDYYKDNC